MAILATVNMKKCCSNLLSFTTVNFTLLILKPVGINTIPKYMLN